MKLVKQPQENFKLKVVETKHALKCAAFIAKNSQARADESGVTI